MTHLALAAKLLRCPEVQKFEVGHVVTTIEANGPMRITDIRPGMGTWLYSVDAAAEDAADEYREDELTFWGGISRKACVGEF